MITPGRILYKIYHRPIEVIQKTLKTGLRRTAEIQMGQRQMMQAALKLKEITYSTADTYHVYFLTGKKYWFQTAFCLYSLQKLADTNIHAVIVDDGSFDDHLERNIRQQFPTTITIIRAEELKYHLDTKLPEINFPVLRQRRIIYPHLRKLTDIHVLPGADSKLVLDSDMLFFHKPIDLLKWLSNPKELLFMRDVSDSYGYTMKLMKELTGCMEIPSRLNVGVAGIASSKIDWIKLEYWTEELTKREGTSYLQEQAITAMIAAKETHLFLEEEKYKVLPVINGNQVPEILHHYVADAKYDYFVKGWKFFVYN